MAHQLKDSLEKQVHLFQFVMGDGPSQTAGGGGGDSAGRGVRRAACPGLGPLEGLSFPWPLTSPGDLVAEESGVESPTATLQLPSPHDKFHWVLGEIRNSNFSDGNLMWVLSLGLKLGQATAHRPRPSQLPLVP